MNQPLPKPWWSQPKIWALAAAGALTVAIAVVIWGTLNRVVVKSNSSAASQSQVVASSSPTPTPPPDPNRDRVIALFGYGGGGHAGGRLTDTMMLAVVQPKRQRIVLISVPRDIWVQLPLLPNGTVGSKLNAAYSYGLDQKQYLSRPAQFTGPAGGGELAKVAISQVTGLSPEHFVAIDFNGFVKSIDQVGGVDIRVTQPFVDEWYPIEGKENDTCEKSPEELAAVATLSGVKAEQAFPCRYERLEFLAGEQHLDGTTALKYVRSRHSAQAGNDFNRALRQQQVLEAIKTKLLAVSALPKLPGLLSTLAKHVTTSLPVTEWDDWLTRASELPEYTIDTVVLDDDLLVASRSADRQFILVPPGDPNDWSAIHAWIITQLSGI